MSLQDRDEGSERRGRWMADAQRGDAHAYGNLLDDLGPMVMNFLRRRVRDAEEVQDMYQEIFLALHRARHTYDPTRPLEPWLFTIARHVLFRHRQRRQAREGREVLVDFPPEIPVESESHLKPQLEQAIRGLSPDQRRALELLRVDGVSIGAAARRAGTTPGALKVRAHRAYKALRQLL
jgi:RNA polymerase sigma-70 factor (ECF subfamily)